MLLLSAGRVCADATHHGCHGDKQPHRRSKRHQMTRLELGALVKDDQHQHRADDHNQRSHLTPRRSVGNITAPSKPSASTHRRLRQGVRHLRWRRPPTDSEFTDRINAETTSNCPANMPGSLVTGPGGRAQSRPPQRHHPNAKTPDLTARHTIGNRKSEIRNERLTNQARPKAATRYRAE